MLVRERRRWERSRLSAVASLNREERSIAARLEDVSLGGAFLHLEEEVHAGRGPYLVSIAFGRDPEEAISGLVRIVDAARQFIRVQWQQPLAPEDWAKLRQLIERQFGTLTVVQKRLPMLIWPSVTLKTRPSRR
jgi:PilZ domain-containing protein